MKVLRVLAAATMGLALWALAPLAFAPSAVATAFAAAPPADRPNPGDANAANDPNGGRSAAPREKVRVLLVSGGAGREFQYLRNALTRQTDEYLVTVWQQNGEPKANQGSSSLGMGLIALPRTAEGLAGTPGDANSRGYHVVILYDPQHVEGSFDKTFVQEALKPFVWRRGGGLCYIAGKKSTEKILGASPEFAALRELLPVVVAPTARPPPGV